MSFPSPPNDAIHNFQTFPFNVLNPQTGIVTLEEVVQSIAPQSTYYSKQKRLCLGNAYIDICSVLTLTSNGEGLMHLNPPSFVVLKLNKSLGLDFNENVDADSSALFYLNKTCDGNKNIIGLIEILKTSDSETIPVMDFIPSTLDEFIEELKEYNFQFSEGQARYIFRQILNALHFLHSNNVAHRDIACDNILINFQSECTCKLIDFGLSVLVERDPLTGEVAKVPFINDIGKDKYRAPEVYRQDSPVDILKGDIWAAGVILYMLLGKGATPCEEAYMMYSNYRKIKRGKLRQVLQEANLVISENAMDLLERMLKVDPEERISTAEILQHPFMDGQDEAFSCQSILDQC